MKTLENIKLVCISILLVAGLAACDKAKQGPAETAGKKIDQTVTDAGRKMGEAADKMGETADKTAEKMGEKSDKAGVAVDDAEITAKVKAAIFAEPGLKTLQISVNTVKGVVTLTGSVDSQSSSDRAKSLAAAVAGVNEVDNRLVPKSMN